MTSVNSDTEAVEAVHAAWFESNVGLQIEKMLDQFPQGDAYLQFNLNGLTYRGAREKAKLWTGIKRTGGDITSIRETSTPSVHVEGDVAWIAGEGIARIRLGAPSSSKTPSDVPFRFTEIYRRNDNAGNPKWTIWHMHCSPAAPAGTPDYGDQ